MPVNPERESLLAPNRVDHDCSPVLAEIEDSFPDLLADTSRNRADEHTRGNLQEPSRQVSTQAGRTSSEDEDYHGTSSL
jgi:hypothetical protein